MARAKFVSIDCIGYKEPQYDEWHVVDKEARGIHGLPPRYSVYGFPQGEDVQGSVYKHTNKGVALRRAKELNKPLTPTHFDIYGTKDGE